jgi:nitroreductase/NAD-dependent dihydropyrimidine dehydrogenase PreA subunit
MPLMEVDESLCERCGLCALDCIGQIIDIDEDGLPSISSHNEHSCYKCQHCLAVCPSGALSILGKIPADSIDLDTLALPTYEEIDNFTRSRRSIRSYQYKNVDSALLKKILKTLAFAPTGTNAEELTFNVIDDKAEMRKFVELLVDTLIEAGKNKSIALKYPRVKAFAQMSKEALIATLSRNAPHALIVSASPDASCAQEDVVIALSYFEFLAQSAGLGTVWWGLLKFAMLACPELKTTLGIPADHPCYAMLFGIPAIKYARTTQKEDVAKFRRLSF